MARAALEEGRAAVASFFGTRPRQVIFTSGATESVNAATFGVLRADPGAVVMAEVEHSAVREASALWASEVLAVGVDRTGRIDVEELASVLRSRPDVRLVHCQMANHEVGTRQPVAEVAALCRSAGVPLHVDAAAAAGYVPIDFDSLGADLVSVSAHKLGGPAGIGALLVRRGTRIPPLVVGGAQERARRGGMENVAAAAGFGATAAFLAEEVGSAGTRMAIESHQASEGTAWLRAAAGAVDGVTVYGPALEDGRLPHLLCLGVDGVEAEGVLVGLDRAGVAAHSGSSCSSEALEPSPVLRAMGVDAERSLRLSVGWSTTREDLELAAAVFPDVVGGLRRLRSS
jgi:cysteine desulfurase